MRQALPSAPVLKQAVDAIKQAIFWTVLTAMLLGAVMGIVAYGVYLLLMMQGVLPLTALTITGVLMVFVAVIGALLARQRTRELSEIEFFPSVSSNNEETLQVLLTAFVEGMTADKGNPAQQRVEDELAPEATVELTGHSNGKQSQQEGSIR